MSKDSSSVTERPTWFVTGTSNGFGLSLSLQILRAGHNLVSLSRYEKPSDSLVAIATYIDPLVRTTESNSPDTASRPLLYHICHDLSVHSENDLKSKVNNLLSLHPSLKISILVNNAAICAFCPLELIPTETLEKVMTINFYSPLWLIQALLPSIRSSPGGGTPKVIVNISSTQGLCSDASEVAYDASKHALEGLSGVLAKEIEPFGIRTLIVNFGSLRTGFASSGQRAGFSSASKSAGSENTDQDTQNSGNTDDTYGSDHPARMREVAVLKFASIPNAAKGDPDKAAGILFDGVMCEQGSAAEIVLAKQRQNGGLERLVIGSDGWPKIDEQIRTLLQQVGSCQELSSQSDASDVFGG